MVADYGLALSERDHLTLARIAQGLRMAADHERERYENANGG